MDDPVPVRSAAIGCLVIAVAAVAVGLLLRPAIFTVAPLRDDSAVIVAAASQLGPVPIRRDLVLTRSYGWAGEIDAGEGRVQVAILLVRSTGGTVSAINASSPVQDDCPVEVGPDRLTDCGGRSWTFEGLPIDPADPPLERFAVEIDGTSVVVDFTSTVDR